MYSILFVVVCMYLLLFFLIDIILSLKKSLVAFVAWLLLCLAWSCFQWTYHCAYQWYCYLVVATWSSSRGQLLKKVGGGRGGRAQRLIPQCVPCCSSLFVCVFSVVVDWHNVIVEKAVVCSFYCMAIVAPGLELFPMDLPLCLSMILLSCYRYMK